MKTVAASTLCLCCTLAACFLSGCGQKTTILQRDEVKFPQAVHLFQVHGCTNCHGDNLQGGVGPNLQQVGSHMTEQQIFKQIEVGGGPMPGFGPKYQAIMTDHEIQVLSQWLAQQK